MILKIICIIVLFCLIVYVGYGILSYYKKRQQFYEDLSNFINYLNTEISFLKTDLVSIIDKNCNSYHSEMNDLLKFYLENIKAKKNNFEAKIKVLSKEENLDISNFFNSLGKTNLQEQQTCIAHYKCRFSEQKTKSEEDKNKNGLTYFKLCIVVGLGVCIVLI